MNEQELIKAIQSRAVELGYDVSDFSSAECCWLMAERSELIDNYEETKDTHYIDEAIRQYIEAY